MIEYFQIFRKFCYEFFDESNMSVFLSVDYRRNFVQQNFQIGAIKSQKLKNQWESPEV